MLTQKDKTELKEMMVMTFVEGFEQVVLPAMNEMKRDLEVKIDGVKQDLEVKIDELDTKVGSMNDRKLDDFGKRLAEVEKKVAFL